MYDMFQIMALVDKIKRFEFDMMECHLSPALNILLYRTS